MSTDHTTLYTNDEVDNMCQSGLLDFCSDLNEVAFPNTRIFDISSLEDIWEAREFVNTNAHPSVDHNLYVRGEHIYSYSANYEDSGR